MVAAVVTVCLHIRVGSAVERTDRQAGRTGRAHRQTDGRMDGREIGRSRLMGRAEIAPSIPDILRT